MVQLTHRLAIIAAAAIFCVGVSFAQGGKVEVEGGDTYNWGTLPPGKLKAELTVRNVGQGTLVIDTVRPSCGCTTSPIDKKVLEPGETATVHVTLDASYRQGHLEKSVTIVSNDSTTPYHFVRLIAEIKPTLSVAPTTNFVLANGKVGVEGATAPVTIRNMSDEPQTIQPPQVGPGGNVDVRFDMDKPRVLAPGESMELSAKVTPRDSRSIIGSVTIETTASDKPTLTFGVTGTLAPATDSGVVGHR